VTVAQQERAIRTRKAILEAAAAIFDERGYETATISDVLERAEVTKGALYFHFASKETLARGVLEGAVTTEGVLRQDLKLQELVDVMLLMAFRLPREPMLSAAMRIAVDPGARAVFGTRWPDWILLMADLVGQAKARGEVHQHIDEVGTGRLLVGAWTGVCVVTEGLPDEYDLTREIAALLQMVVAGIATPSALAKVDISENRAADLFAAIPDRSGHSMESDR